MTHIVWKSLAIVIISGWAAYSMRQYRIHNGAGQELEDVLRQLAQHAAECEFNDEAYELAEKQVVETPPRCLSGFSFSDGQRASKNDTFCTWPLRCRCGHTTGRALGYSVADINPKYDGPVSFVSPLAFECASCTSITEIIDTAQHGYDAEICNDPKAAMRGEGPRQVYQCEHCGHSEFEFEASFGYSHFDHIEDEPELAPKAMDHFDSFGCLGTCKNCGKQSYIASFELA